MLNDPERFMIRALTIGVVLCAMARAATAQEATLQVGGRARVRTMLLSKWSYGRVISVDSGGVLLDPCVACEGSEIPRTHIQMLQASAGHTGRSYALEGAIIGATIGAYLAYRDVQRRGGRVGLGNQDMFACARSCATTASKLYGGFLGAVAGTTIGAFFRRERWESVNPWPH